MGIIILRDGLAVAEVHDESDALRWFHHEHSFSMDHALAHEGYALESRPELVRGWQAFLLMSGRRGYGVAGSLARLAVELQRLVSAYERDAEAVAGEWRDYVSAPSVAMMLRGYADALQNSGPDAGAFDIIRGALHSWAIATCERIGEVFDA